MIQRKKLLLLILGGVVVFISLNLKMKNAPITPLNSHSEKKTSLQMTDKPFSFSGMMKFNENGEFDLTGQRLFKEQIERDLTSFSFIESAKAAFFLDENDRELSKLSLIITPTEDIKILTNNQVHSLIGYIKGHLGHIHTNMISVTDHNGVSYSTEFHQEELAVEQQENKIKNSLSLHISNLMPKKHYFLNFQLKKNSRNDWEGYLDIILNTDFLKTISSKSKALLMDNLINKSQTFISKEGLVPIVSVNSVPFFSEHSMDTRLLRLPKWIFGTVYLTISGLFILAAYYYLLKKTTSTGSGCYDIPVRDKKNPLKKLADLLSKQDVDKVALILSYLDEKRTREIKNLLPENMRNFLDEYGK
ncbi:MAG: hypothetical protein RSB82_00120 [Victivallaceae bacterium]